MSRRLTILLFSITMPLVNAQWKKTIPTEKISSKNNNSIFYKLDINELRGQLLAADVVTKGKNVGAVTISIPTMEGQLERFAVNSYPVINDKLANQYQLGSYVGVGIDDPTKYIRFSVAPNDFQSMIITKGKYEFIEPATDDKALYSVHSKTAKEGSFFCSTKEDEQSFKNLEDTMKGKSALSGNKTFHTLRLAISVTGEYGAYFGGAAGALAQINATMTRVNGVFEQEFNTHLNVINPDAQLIFTDKTTNNSVTNPYSKYTYMCKWNYELLNVLHGGNYGVKDEDFDIGHLFGRSGGGGNAGCIGCIGSNDVSYTLVAANDPNGCGYDYNEPENYKGSGITSPGSGAPKGDNFDIDYVAHEMGHQLGDNHTFSRNEGTQVTMEPGSGSTIMAYAGVVSGGTTTNVQPHSDPYFHWASIDQVQKNLVTKTVDIETNIDNNPPVVADMTGTSYAIPKSTAFVLTASATDPEGDTLTYCWEQVDRSTSSSYTTQSSLGSNNTGANFRSLIPTASPTRYFPKLATVLGGSVKNTSDWEAATSIARTTTFRVTVRDNKGKDTQTAYTTQKIIVGNANAFTVDTTSLVPDASNTIGWTVSGTTASPYNVANVKIDYTTDATGATGWTTLAESVPNSGSATVNIPASLAEKTVYLRVSAIGNVFYAAKAASVGKVLSVSDVSSKSVQVYPNPVKDVLNISYVPTNASYEILNVAGQVVTKGNLFDGKAAVSRLVKGVYFINIDQQGTSIKTKFIKD